MKVVWEKNSRVDELVGTGKVNQKDVIKRTSTNNFPEGKATVRLKDVRSKTPWITIHIKGKHNPKLTQQGWKYWNCHHSCTTRVTFGGGWGADVFSFNGYLQDEETVYKIPEIIMEVKEALELGGATALTHARYNYHPKVTAP